MVASTKWPDLEEVLFSMPESYGFLSTYPPTQCGLASFTASLAAALGADLPPGAIGVTRAVEHRGALSPPEVLHELVTTAPGGEAAAAAALDKYGVVIVQHEYGIYGGRDGESVVSVIQHLRAPVIAVLHTVLTAPTDHQRQVLERVAAEADAVVVMTETARRRLLAGYRVSTDKVELIPHGAPDLWSAEHPSPEGRSPTLLTWGLLGPGKGIEWAVRALADLGDLDPPVQYVVAGETHPLVAERYGESYRTMLRSLAASLGVGNSLRFLNRYLPRADLRSLVATADVVVLPYDSTEQVTSGVLTEAVSAGRPVVATAFPHALELLSSGAGIIVPQRDPVAIGSAVRRILTDPLVAPAMVAAAARIAPTVTWAAVAERYRDLGRRLRADAALVGA